MGRDDGLHREGERFKRKLKDEIMNKEREFLKDCMEDRSWAVAYGMVAEHE